MLNHLFSPFEIEGKQLKNRCVVPAMVMNFATKMEPVQKNSQNTMKPRQKAALA